MYFQFHKNTRYFRKMPVSTIMKNRTLQTVHRKDTIPKLLQMFKKHKVNNFPVVDNKGKLIGDVDLRNILPFAINPDHMSEHDIIGAVGTQIHEIFGDAVEDIMNLHQEMIKPDELIEDAAFIMWKFNIHCIPVVKDNKLVGVVSDTDIANILVKTMSQKKIDKTGDTE